MYPRNRKQLIPVILFVVITAIVVINSCRRIQHEELLAPKENSNETRFFNVPSTVDPIIKALANKIYRQNEKYHFVNDLVKRVGFPVWDKSLIVTNQGVRAASARVMDDSTTLIYVPFAIDSAQLVKATLLAQLSPEDSVFRLVYDWEYRRFGFDSTTNYTWKAKDIFHLFARFQKSIYNHQSFQIIDGRILGRDSAWQPIASFDQNNSWQRLNTLQPVTVCDIYITCDTSCKRAFKITTGYCGCPTVHNLCSTQWINVDPGGGSMPSVFYTTSIGEGGINDAQTWWVNQCPGGGGGGVPKMSVTQECSATGWIPMPTSGSYQYSQLGFHHLETWDVSGEDYGKIQFWRQNNIDTIGLDSCRRLILNKLLSVLNNNLMGKILSKIDRSIKEPNNLEKFKVKYEMKRLDSSVAQTTSFAYNTTTKIFSCTVTLDSAIAKTATDIYVAGTILHETIHAYMKSVLYRIKNGVTLSQLQAMSYASVFNEYVDSLRVRNRALIPTILKDLQNDHNFMATKLIDIIADALKEFDNNIINNDRYYWFLTWKGLFDTKPWQQHWPNYATLPIVGAPLTTEDSTRGLKYALTPLRLDSINTAIGNERQSNANSKGRKPITGGCY